jgi:hypothetical protein
MKNSRYKKASSRIARRSKAKKVFGLILKVGLPVAFLVGLIFLLRADFLQVKSFEVSGTADIPVESIKNTASGFISGNNFFVIPKSNILFLNKGELAAAIMSQFGRMEKVDINKQFLSERVDLNISERKGDFLWCSLQDECFFMTKDGLVFEKTENKEDKVIFRGILTSNPLMKNFATPAKMQNYLKLIEVLKGAGFEVGSINIESNDRAVTKSNVGDIIFNPEETDLSLVAQNVILLINDVKGKNPSAEFNYIDARFGNKIFYKLY